MKLPTEKEITEMLYYYNTELNNAIRTANVSGCSTSTQQRRLEVTIYSLKRLLPTPREE